MIKDPAAPGSVFEGKYLIERQIGLGGFGVILAAMHTHLEQRVAIKLLTGAASLDKDRVGRFTREAKAAARIQSEHVVRILDFGIHEETGTPFIVMEYLEGRDLNDIVKERGPLPVDQALHYFIQACSGVAKAHFASIVHRDLKPSNLFVVKLRDGTSVLKVLDFGASKLMAECSLSTGDIARTLDSTIIGSPRYMAPEQLKEAHAIDTRADVYSLGATLWELLAGQPMIAGGTISTIFTKILWDPPPSITAVREGVPAGLEAIVYKCLKKQADERFQSVKELVAALAPYAGPQSTALIEQVSAIGRAAVSIAPPPQEAAMTAIPRYAPIPRAPVPVPQAAPVVKVAPTAPIPPVAPVAQVSPIARVAEVVPQVASFESHERAAAPSPASVAPLPWQVYALVGVASVAAGVVAGTLLFFTLIYPLMTT